MIFFRVVLIPGVKTPYFEDKFLFQGRYLYEFISAIADDIISSSLTIDRLGMFLCLNAMSLQPKVRNLSFKWKIPTTITTATVQLPAAYILFNCSDMVRFCFDFGTVLEVQVVT